MPNDEEIANLARRIRAQGRDMRRLTQGFEVVAGHHRDTIRALRLERERSELALEELLEKEDPPEEGTD